MDKKDKNKFKWLIEFDGEKFIKTKINDKVRCFDYAENIAHFGSSGTGIIAYSVISNEKLEYLAKYEIFEKSKNIIEREIKESRKQLKNLKKAIEDREPLEEILHWVFDERFIEE